MRGHYSTGLRSRSTRALAAACLGLLATAAGADDWPAARVANVFSADGRHFVRIVPGQSIGDTVGFAGAPKGAYARAEVHTRQPDRSDQLVAEMTLINPVAPVDALVSDTGAFITFDNWHNAGHGRVVAIYGPRGIPIASYELERLYPPDRVARLSVSVSSRWWRCPAMGYVDPDRQTMVYVTERLGGTFVFELASGRFEYRPGTARCP